MKIKLAALTIAVLLAACGGGGSTSTTTSTAQPPITQPPTNAEITTSSEKTVSALGASVITAANATSQAYNLVADIGDSWKINFDTTAKTYTVTILLSQYGLTNASTNTMGNFTSSTNGVFTTYTLDNGAGTLTLDTRTKSLSGTLTIGSKASTVAGTGYQAGSDLTKLAGSYYFMYATRNQNGGDHDRGIGQLKISSTGTTAILCSNGTVNASNTCDVVVSGLATELNAFVLSVSNDVVLVSGAGGAVWGRLYVHASDLGKAFMIDRYGLNRENVLRVGALYAAESTKALAGTEANGTWKCSAYGRPRSRVVGAGTTLTITDLTVVNGSTWIETLNYNQIATSQGYFNVNGVANSGRTAALNARSIIFPLSSTLVIAADLSPNATGLLNCGRELL